MKGCVLVNFVNRAIINVKRKIGKSVILLILVFILGNIIAGAISIREALKNTENSIRKNVGVVASIEVDYDAIYESGDDTIWDNMPILSVDAIKSIGSLKMVKFYDYSLSISLSSKVVKRIEAEMGIIAKPFDSGEYEAYFNLTGVENKEIAYLKNGQGKIISGRHFTDEEIKNGSNVIVVSKEFAELNNLSIGSKITLNNNIYDFSSMYSYDISGQGSVMPIEPTIVKKFELELEVVGIFELKKMPIKKDKNGKEDEYEKYMEAEKQNQIFAPNKFILVEQEKFYAAYKEINPNEAISELESYTPIFVLNDPRDLDEFKSLAKKELPEFYKIIDNSSAYKKMQTPLNSIGNMANIILYVSIGATLIVISLLITLFLRDRKHEIGIYLSLGESKKNVACQIALEVIVVSLIGMTLSLVTGTITSKVISEGMLVNEVENMSSDDEYNTLTYLGYNNAVSVDDIKDAYKISFSIGTISIFYIVGTLTILLSTVAPIMYMTRLNPKKIMM